jgi:hypothetical protein
MSKTPKARMRPAAVASWPRCNAPAGVAINTQNTHCAIGGPTGVREVRRDRRVSFYVRSAPESDATASRNVNGTDKTGQ